MRIMMSASAEPLKRPGHLTWNALKKKTCCPIGLVLCVLKHDLKDNLCLILAVLEDRESQLQRFRRAPRFGGPHEGNILNGFECTMTCDDNMPFTHVYHGLLQLCSQNIIPQFFFADGGFNIGTDVALRKCWKRNGCSKASSLSRATVIVFFAFSNQKRSTTEDKTAQPTQTNRPSPAPWDQENQCETHVDVVKDLPSWRPHLASRAKTCKKP